MVKETSFRPRRKFLKSTGSAIAVGGSHPFVIGSARGVKTVKIPKLVSGGDPVKYIEVPKVWNEHRQRAATVVDENQQLRNIRDATSLGLVRSPEKYGGKNGLQIQVGVREGFDNGDKIPSSIDGLPVTTTQRPPGKPSDCEATYNCRSWDGNYVMFGGEHLNSGSACSWLYDYNKDERFLLTVAHLWYGEDSIDDESNCPADSDIVGNDANVPGRNDEKVGDVCKASVTDDWAVIDKNAPNVNASFETDIESDEHGFEYVAGYVTEATLCDWTSRDKQNRPCVYQMGKTTGTTGGRVDGCKFSDGVNTCIDFDSGGSADGVYTFCDFGVGDSGGPTYHLEGGDAYIVSVTSLRYFDFGSSCGFNVGNDSSGISGYQINDVLPFKQFGSPAEKT